MVFLILSAIGATMHFLAADSGGASAFIIAAVQGFVKKIQSFPAAAGPTMAEDSLPF